MTTTISITGDVLNAQESSWFNKDTKQNQLTKVVQFLSADGKGRAIILNVKLPENADVSVYQKGRKVTIPVDVVAVEGQIFYRAKEIAPEPDVSPRASTKPAATG